MVRTQIQLTAEQVAMLKQLAMERGVSVSELVRQGVDAVLKQSREREKRRRALLVMGRYASGYDDISANHDRYLAEDYHS